MARHPCPILFPPPQKNPHGVGTIVTIISPFSYSKTSAQNPSKVAKTLDNYAVGLVGAIHFGVAGAEMFLWKRWNLRERFPKLQLTRDEADKVSPIVANAGLYNAFIASGLLWSVFVTGDISFSLKCFFLSCVTIAGFVGVTLTWKTLLLQTLPTLIAAVFVWVANNPA